MLLPENASKDVAKANGSEFLSQRVKNYKYRDTVVLNKTMDHETNFDLKKKYNELLPGIHQILYINLDKRKDRMSEIIDEFQKLGVNPHDLTRISAEYTPEKWRNWLFSKSYKSSSKSYF